ncbi:MAG: outer membrane lipoprotein-sorting protein [Chitinivibrionales bacterium]|nr:outer membrane lipoprotein-sorting protein [Chitinivibrionales bacterium]MBD3359018.1 outer membrane lipoprotein-sorting protein [Chitinivibrionales bacterium]
MRITQTTLLVIMALANAWTAPRSASDSAVVAEIAQKYDNLYKSKSSHSKMEMEIITPHYRRTLMARVWTEGKEKMLIRILEPRKERGVGTLKIGDDMWNYLPKTNKIIKIPPSMMMSSWMGSDFTNDDLVREYTLLEDYMLELIDPDTVAESLYVLKAEPKSGRPIIWNKILLAVRRDDYLPVWQENYDESGDLMRVFKFSDYTTFDKRTIPAVMTLVPQDKEGHKTVLRYLAMEFEVDVDKGVFSLRNLRSPVRER